MSDTFLTPAEELAKVKNQEAIRRELTELLAALEEQQVHREEELAKVETLEASKKELAELRARLEGRQVRTDE